MALHWMIDSRRRAIEGAATLACGKLLDGTRAQGA
jgi:hypothetical protein